MGKWQNTIKHNIQESQEVSSFPASDNKAARNRHDSMIDKHETQITKMIHYLELSVRKLLEGLNMFDGTSLNTICDD